MDNTNYTAEHRKGQHLLNEERHEIEVRLKDGWSIYRIAKHLGRPYNTVKNEIKRGTVSLIRARAFPITPLTKSASLPTASTACLGKFWTTTPPKNFSAASLTASMPREQ